MNRLLTKIETCLGMLQLITFWSVSRSKVDADAWKRQSLKVREADRPRAIFAAGRRSVRRRRPADEALPDDCATERRSEV
ncbi:hypothetical protein ASD64_12450 [Mesorhizobium sp. Root157]|nr:hypothetical protein ASD64_12450 [Mesorhizobium sp. Root157]